MRAYDNTSVTNNPGGFNFKEFQSNIVFRWEYQPGLDALHRLERGAAGVDAGRRHADFDGDVRDLMRLHPANTFIVKVSYWLNR